ncbi:hypothetical protein N7509_012109 [Penicillium cosmopolitanum]|uniref:Chromatin assembly factor 1 subunit A n=1 Tax=Penicillium cosmopolitanum TaxID=1131564 RepID=A0A9W9SJ99_9EURO|nr:uncharacterized protein N7509_012109 [Penicillium cosmopolitanum]KAJ5378990.1 hypothetical protein N7509_012109 [Penicillium cosmopolitanum]
MSLSPLPPSTSIPPSPSASVRKRSIHEVDDLAVPELGPKRPLTNKENQENHDPRIVESPEKGPTSPKKPSGSQYPTPVVEIPTRSCPSKSAGSASPTACLTVECTTAQLNSAQSSTTAMPTPASKRRKLSPASQQAKQEEKDTKERQRLEEKQRKEDEKRAKAEEKKKRDAEREEEKRLREEEKKEEKKKRDAKHEEEKKQREEKKRAKDEEKAAKDAAKDEEKRKKEEEKLKKERSQMRLNNFFAKPQLPSSASSTVPPSPSKKAPNGDAAAENPQTSESDYKKAFPEFFLQSHTIVAPPHRFDRDSDALKHVRDTLDAGLNSVNGTNQQFPYQPSEIFHMIPYRRRYFREWISTTFREPTTETPGTATQDHDEITQIRRGYPSPYQGTYTRTMPETTALKLSRNPYYRGLPDTNYDYDSEAEWEEPEEGEDLDSEEEDEGSDEGEDDMEGFLDDEDDALVGGKRRLIVGDLEPVNSGIRWATDGGVDDDLKQYQIETILDAVKFPIDPFSTVYWQKPRAAEQASAKNKATNNQAKGANTPSIFKVPSSDKACAGGTLPPPPATKAKRPFPPEHLEEFKQVIEGSDLSKIGVVEILKKRFPKVSKDTLKVTLDQVAVRVGQKEADKKWVCR